jgi:uncharacterized membrane protein
LAALAEAPALRARSSARHHISLVPGALGGTLFVALTALALLRHAAFQTGRHDLEIYSQVTWNLANGAPFASTLLRTNTLHLAEHLALALLPLAPLYGLSPDPRLLLVLQQAALVVGALAIGQRARHELGSRLGSVTTLVILLTPALSSVALDDFHVVALTLLPIALGLVCLRQGSARSALLLLLLAVLIEEEASLAMLGVGLMFAARRAWRLAGSSLIFGAVPVLLAAVVIMPGFHAPGTLHPGQATRSSGHFSGFMQQPQVLLDRAAGERGRAALLAMLLPSGGLAIASPADLVGAIPTFGALFLQDRDDTFDRHWIVTLLPAVWLASIATLVRAGRWRRLGFAALLAGSAGSYLLSSPLPGGGSFSPAELVRGDRESALSRASQAVPQGAAAAVSAPVTAHLTDRRELYVYPIDDVYLAALRYEDRPVEAFVLDFTDPATQHVAPLSKHSPLMANPPFIIRSTGHKVLVLTRTVSPPERPLDLYFNRSMSLRGYDLARGGSSVTATLYWERVAGIFADFRRIVELVDGNGRVLASDNDLELTRTLQTQKWQVGQKVLDDIQLSIPPGAGPDLKLRVQWQNRDRRSPMLLPDGSTFVELPL